jgi:hypothetical protein
MHLQCCLVKKSRLPCPSGQAGTTLSLTVTLSVVEGCFLSGLLESMFLLNKLKLKYN